MADGGALGRPVILSAVPSMAHSSKLPAGFVLQEFLVRKRTPKEVRALRKSYKPLRSTLVGTVAKRYQLLVPDLDGYEMHHRFPLAVQLLDSRGDPIEFNPNAAAFIDPVSPLDHDVLHDDIIDPQYNEREAGDVFGITLPVRVARPTARLALSALRQP